MRLWTSCLFAAALLVLAPEAGAQSTAPEFAYPRLGAHSYQDPCDNPNSAPRRRLADKLVQKLLDQRPGVNWRPLRGLGSDGCDAMAEWLRLGGSEASLDDHLKASRWLLKRGDPVHFAVAADVILRRQSGDDLVETIDTVELRLGVLTAAQTDAILRHPSPDVRHRAATLFVGRKVTQLALFVPLPMFLAWFSVDAEMEISDEVPSHYLVALSEILNLKEEEPPRAVVAAIKARIGATGGMPPSLALLLVRTLDHGDIKHSAAKDAGKLLGSNSHKGLDEPILAALNRNYVPASLAYLAGIKKRVKRRDAPALAVVEGLARHVDAKVRQRASELLNLAARLQPRKAR